MAEVTPELKKRFRSGLTKVLKEVFEEDTSGYRTLVVNIENVGASFEPRTRFTYDRYHGKEYLGRFSKTAIYETDGTIVTVLDD